MVIHRAFLWTGSQIPAYLLGGIAPLIYSEIGGYNRWVWFVLAYLLSLASICPFVGSLSDLIGRRYVAFLGSGLLIIAMIVAGTAHNMGQFIGIPLSSCCFPILICISWNGHTGVGAGICELTCLAGTSELAPTRKRGLYVAALVLTIIPFCPSALYAWLIASYSTWRWCAFISGVWALVGAIGVLLFYFPPPRPNS